MLLLTVFHLSPYRLWRNTSLISPSELNKTAAEARVACPHKGTSHFGVNQRRPKQDPSKAK